MTIKTLGSLEKICLKLEIPVNDLSSFLDNTATPRAAVAEAQMCINTGITALARIAFGNTRLHVHILPAVTLSETPEEFHISSGLR